METIKIECEGKATLALSELNPLQGEMKTLSDQNYEKLKKEIIEDGFSFPFAVWESPLDAQFYIIDGHQRFAVLNKMKSEGWAIPQVPVVFVRAPDLKTAKKKLLAAASQYGTMSEQGLIQFLGSDFDFEEVATTFNFPEIDLGGLMVQMNPEISETTVVSTHERSLSGGEDDATQNAEHQVRMVQLFFNGETHPEFMNMALKLQDKHNTLNLTDTVMEVFRAAFKSL